MAKTKRSKENQHIHDIIIEYIAKNRFPGYDIFTNPGTATEYRVGGSYYPDVLVFKKGTKDLVAVGEVETDDTLTSDEAISQWKAYSELGVPFYLYMPEQHYNRAKHLCEENQIEVKGFRHYDADNPYNVKRGNI